MELQALLPLIPEIWATKEQKPLFMQGRLEWFWQGWKGVTPFGSFVLGSLGWLKTPEGTGRGPWGQGGVARAAGIDPHSHPVCSS